MTKKKVKRSYIKAPRNSEKKAIPSDAEEETQETNVRLKLLIDTAGKRVLYAEAGKEFVDFLFDLLSLPLATIVRLLRTQGMVGSFPNIYKSLETLGDAYILPDQNKDAFLKPAAPVSSSSAPLLALGEGQTQMFYRCTKCCVFAYTDDLRPVCSSCGRKMTSSVPPPADPSAAVEAAKGGGGLVKGVVTYMVMDDLTVTPMSAISSLTMLNKFNVKNVGALEERVVYLGSKEVVKLLKGSLLSDKVLTDVFC